MNEFISYKNFKIQETEKLSQVMQELKELKTNDFIKRFSVWKHKQPQPKNNVIYNGYSHWMDKLYIEFINNSVNENIKTKKFHSEAPRVRKGSNAGKKWSVEENYCICDYYNGNFHIRKTDSSELKKYEIDEYLSFAKKVVDISDTMSEAEIKNRLIYNNDDILKVIKYKYLIYLCQTNNVDLDLFKYKQHVSIKRGYIHFGINQKIKINLVSKELILTNITPVSLLDYNDYISFDDDNDIYIHALNYKNNQTI